MDEHSPDNEEIVPFMPLTELQILSIDDNVNSNDEYELDPYPQLKTLNLPKLEENNPKSENDDTKLDDWPEECIPLGPYFSTIPGIGKGPYFGEYKYGQKNGYGEMVSNL